MVLSERPVYLSATPQILSHKSMYRSFSSSILATIVLLVINLHSQICPHCIRQLFRYSLPAVFFAILLDRFLFCRYACIFTYSIANVMVDNKTVSLGLWDTAGMYILTTTKRFFTHWISNVIIILFNRSGRL